MTLVKAQRAVLQQRSVSHVSDAGRSAEWYAAQLETECTQHSADTARYKELRAPIAPTTVVTATGAISFGEPKLRYQNGFADYVKDALNPENPNRIRLTPALALPELKGKVNTVVLFCAFHSSYPST